MTMIDAARLRTTGPARAGNAAGAASGTRPSGGAFHVADGPDEGAGSGAADAAAPLVDTAAVSLGTMLAAEALDRGATHDRTARRKGQVLLAGLAALQRALLGGGDPAEVVERLARLLDDIPQAADPRLAALLGTIVLRARVELARLGR